MEELIEISVDRNLAKSKKSRKSDIFDEGIRINRYVEGLSVLGRKYNMTDNKEDLSLPYQKFVFRLINLYPKNNQIVSGSMSLLALISKDTRVRRRFKYSKEDYGLNRPIDVLKNVLERSKEERCEMKEAVLAEILRKGCLFLGAVCNDDQDLGLQSIIVSEGGLELILDAANWFRLHEELSKWALWATFIISYNNFQIKMELVQLQGIQIICTLMQNNQTSREVNRHGTALLFDLMRDGKEDEIPWNPWKVRKIAIESGLHDRIVSAMNVFSDSTDIVMMGQQILVGTNYRGNIPQYKPI
eukprot:CAMPEP_0197190744 /NCGR_PEP_ID=MMETSP1423-20130617/22217_1 /TAXON_ID=476441 /ORGANISM="Pseudo-nitzschia heimii, Strain UNC1101" /LENGTH=300 /DNA_ID=CAMNT_0042643197 /DNA_START=282 /DNA_END=1184 /DNA_ORIENTATION=-